MTLNDRSTPLALLRSRRSGRARDMIAPGPDAATLRDIVGIAARTPDHGKLAPWHFVVIHDDARLKDWVKIALTFVICAVTFPSDWSCVAAMAILFMGQARGDFRKQMGWLMVWSAVYALVYFFFIDKVYALVQLGTALAIPLLRCYDGTRGKWRGMGWLFYGYYPAHLALIGVLRVLLWGAGASTAAGSF